MTRQQEIDALVTYVYREWPSVTRQWPAGQIEAWARRLVERVHKA